MQNLKCLIVGKLIMTLHFEAKFGECFPKTAHIVVGLFRLPVVENQASTLSAASVDEIVALTGQLGNVNVGQGNGGPTVSRFVFHHLRISWRFVLTFSQTFFKLTTTTTKGLVFIQGEGETYFCLVQFEAVKANQC